MADKVVRLSQPTHTRLEAMRAVLRAMTGRPVTQAETVERAIDCLTDAHAGKAWLSGAEAGRVMEERHQQQVTAVVGHLLAAVRPDLTLDGVGFDAVNGQAHIVIRGEQTITLAAASLTAQGE